MTETFLYFGEWLHGRNGRSGPIIVLVLLSAAAAAALWSRMEIMVTLLISSV